MATRRSLDALTGVRFLAALQVLCLHFAPHSLKAIYPLGHIAQTGYVAVSFFFVLSGFVLAYNYVGRDGVMTVGRKEFWVARFARIYPAYFLGLLLTFPVFLGYMREGTDALWRIVARTAVFGSTSLLLLQSWLPNTSLLWNFPGWSLSAEACFYVLFPVLVVALRFARRPAQLLLTMFICWVATQIVPILYLATSPQGTAAPWPAWQGMLTMDFDGPFSRVLRFNPALHIPEFCIGLCLGKLFLTRERFSTAPSNERSGALMSSAGFVLLFIVLAAADRIPFPMLHNGLLAPIFCLVIYGLALGGGPVASLLGSAPLRLAGEVSYGMYILQIPVWLGISAILGKETAHEMTGFLVYLSLHFMVCVLVFWYWEEPARRWLKRMCYSSWHQLRTGKAVRILKRADAAVAAERDCTK